MSIENTGKANLGNIFLKAVCLHRVRQRVLKRRAAYCIVSHPREKHNPIHVFTVSELDSH